jgi:hypothetical protein
MPIVYLYDDGSGEGVRTAFANGAATEPPDDEDADLWEPNPYDLLNVTAASVSDEQSKTEDRNGLSLQGASAVDCEAVETPNLPQTEGEYTGLIESFERWAKARHLDTTLKLKGEWGDHRYLHEHIESMWLGWKSCGEALQQKNKELEEELAKSEDALSALRILYDAFKSQLEALRTDLERKDKALEELLGESGKGNLTIRDLCYTAFMKAKGTNDEDGGPTDWFTDTLPTIEKGLQRMRTEAALSPEKEEGVSHD